MPSSCETGFRGTCETKVLSGTSAFHERGAEMIAMQTLAEPIDTQGEQVTVGGSIGITTGAGNLGELLRQADIAMYAAKAVGKGTIERYREPAAV
ncbi:diguanylate cyclase domain-containing protein [Paractinoplanes durhamensis]|uniref:GGDEF domain-containing protein n=1 Tax=Paractinoplanes durhamensis TaxID=113563 RepID=A0ABQ3Z9P9_9ACTN|nr:diguanylate cyclase [Actinoplanes durhamensis]GIE06540.1 hypothetical protein Adu01nite_78900 [Actinoplanes durhamensis]